MASRISRRDWLKLIGGSAVGLMLTPMPWKILDDTAKWTQNWSLMPVPPDGKITYKYTTCTLCRAACGVRVKCVNNHPVSLGGVAGHPVSAGSLCAMGLAGHVLCYHPSRLARPVRRLKDGDASRFAPVSREDAIAGISKAIDSIAAGAVAVLDRNPKRTISYIYRSFLAEIKNGLYITAPVCDEIPCRLSDAVLHTGNLEFGFDVHGTRTLLSFGAPVLDGWGTQRQFAEIAAARQGTADKRLKIIQVESAHSRTAQLCDRWIPVRPGSEAAFALGVANVIINERLCDTPNIVARSKDFDDGSGRSFVDLVRKFDPRSVSEPTGIAPEMIRQTARELASGKPSLVVFGGNPASGPFSFEEQIIFMDLNILIGSVGARGGMAQRLEVPDPFDHDRRLIPATPLADVPDRSVKALIIDDADSGNAIPWSLIQRKLVPHDAVVLSLSPYLAEAACHADYVLPSPGYLETIGDMTTPPGAAMASYSLTTPVIPQVPGSIHPLDFLKEISSWMRLRNQLLPPSLTMDRLIRGRVDKIHSQRAGQVFDSTNRETNKLSSMTLTSFRKIMERGGCWIADVPVNPSDYTYSFLGGTQVGFDRLSKSLEARHRSTPLVLIPTGTRGCGSVAQQNPMMGKIYKESDDRPPANIVSMNPETGKKSRLKDGGSATIRTESGKVEMRVRLDPSVMPNVLEVSVSPAPSGFDRIERESRSVLDICSAVSDSTWRITEATVEHV